MKHALLSVLLAGMIGCGTMPHTLTQDDIEAAAAVGYLYGQTATTFVVAKSQNAEAEEKALCVSLKQADALSAEARKYWDVTRPMSRMNDLTALRGYCAEVKP
jgi:hypothetical protein